MASKPLIDTAIRLYQNLGGNLSKILGTRTNVNFLGKGRNTEPSIDMDINIEAFGAIPQSRVVSEFESAMGYLTSNKLDDIQATRLIKNLEKANEFYFPPAAPANITDMGTGTRGLTAEGLESLRAMADDLPPPGSRGGADDIAAPISGAGLEAVKDVKNVDLISEDLIKKVYDTAGVAVNAKPVARGNARDFLNTIKDMEDPTNPGGPTLSSIMETDDFKFMTEGGGGIMGDPLLLVQKYFGPRVSSVVANLNSREEIELFAKQLVKVKDVKGNTITDRNFDPTAVDPSDFEFADGGRVGLRGGRLVGKALGLFKKQQALEKGAVRGYADMRKYGIEGEDITNMFKEISMDPTLVGKEKTEYFKVLNQALKNPEQFPDTIKEIQMKLGIDVGLGFKSGGLAKILEL
tara:strand:+ start:773 stop:1993 length:1221 start_codon:yes stop_codon:yes gene_type:complete